MISGNRRDLKSALIKLKKVALIYKFSEEFKNGFLSTSAPAAAFSEKRKSI
jgi:hypothetical protein